MITRNEQINIICNEKLKTNIPQRNNVESDRICGSKITVEAMIGIASQIMGSCQGISVATRTVAGKVGER